MNTFKKDNGFKTPGSYFENFKDKLMVKLSEEKSTLSNAGNHQDGGFTVPKDYFKNLNDKVIAKIDKKETKTIQLNPYHKYYLAAASIAATALLVFGLNWNITKDVTFDDLASNDIENYFENYELGFTENELAELLSMQDVEINDILDQEINEDHIIEYLNNNIEDLQELNTVYDEE